MTAPSGCAFADILASSRAVLVDMDGCLIAGGHPLPGAVDLLRLCGERLWLVSNNSSHGACEMSRHLHRLGLEIPAQRILLAGELVLEVARERLAGQGAMLLARQELRTHAEALGIVQSDRAPALVVLTRDTELDYRRYSLAIKHLSRGVPLLVANPDRSHPDLEGDPVPETGSLLALLQSAVPGLDYQVVGKPGPRLFQAALARAGVTPAESLMIGDNPATDCQGAQALGIRAFLIGRHQQALAADIAGLLRLQSLPPASACNMNALACGERSAG